jgi:hypothetical protein
MTERPSERDEDEMVGDAVCWIAHVCAVCGAMNETAGPCWNCGARRQEE